MKLLFNLFLILKLIGASDGQMTALMFLLCQTV